MYQEFVIAFAIISVVAHAANLEVGAIRTR